MYKILIVDDEKIERNGIKFLLKQSTFEVEVTEAANGETALELLENNKFDILLTDVKMPFMDGIELITNTVEKGIQIKIIIFSGYNEFEYAKFAVKYGVSDYILKPVNPTEFSTTLSKVIGELDNENLEKELKEKSDSFIKEHLLYLAVNGAGIDELKKNTGGIVDVEVLDNYKRMMLVEFNRDFFGRTGIEFADEIKKKLDVDFDYLNLNQQQAVLLFAEEDMDWRSYASNLHLLIRSIYGEEAYIAISESLDGIDSVASQMEELEELMENKFYQDSNYVFTKEITDQTPTIVQIDDDTLMKQMKQDIKMKDVSSLREHFERMCNKYRNKTDFSQVYIKFIFSNLLKDFYDNLPETNEQELNQEIDRLYKSQDFKCVLDIVEINIKRLEKAFSINPQMIHREVEDVKRYIYEHYNEEIGVEQLAEKVYMAPSYLSGVFKKETGQNLSKFIKAYRMEKAKDMLENTHKKIVNISVETGYPNVSYFCQSFREYFGVSPQRFRDQGEQS